MDSVVVPSIEIGYHYYLMWGCKYIYRNPVILNMLTELKSAGFSITKYTRFVNSNNSFHQSWQIEMGFSERKNVYSILNYIILNTYTKDSKYYGCCDIIYSSLYKC